MNPAGLRRGIHAATALLVPAAGWWGWPTVRLGLVILFVLAGLCEVVRIRWPRAQSFWARTVPVFRPGEAHRPSGATWLVLGHLIASWFPPAAAGVGILVGALADPAASLVGGRWGGGQAKSWPGSLAAAGVTAILVLGLGGGWVAIPCGLAASAAERWAGPVNDNVAVGPVSALVYLGLAGV